MFGKQGEAVILTAEPGALAQMQKTGCPNKEQPVRRMNPFR